MTAQPFAGLWEAISQVGSLAGAALVDPAQHYQFPYTVGYLQSEKRMPTKPPTPPDQNEQLKPFLDVCRPLED